MEVQYATKLSYNMMCVITQILNAFIWPKQIIPWSKCQCSFTWIISTKSQLTQLLMFWLFRKFNIVSFCTDFPFIDGESKIKRCCLYFVRFEVTAISCNSLRDVLSFGNSLLRQREIQIFKNTIKDKVFTLYCVC